MSTETKKVSRSGEIEYNNVTFAYPSDGHHEAKILFSNFSLKIPPGSCTLFCGPSGSGKSTALKMLNALIPQLQPGHLGGEIFMSGKKLEEEDLTQIGKLSATVFQNPRTQFFTGQVLAELAYSGENYGVAPEELLKRCLDAAEACHISNLLENSLHTLSGGQLQTVAQASALAAHVPVLLYDEPTANLSPEAITEFSSLLKAQKDAGKTVVIAEHRIYFLKDLVDQVVYFKENEDPRIISGKDFFCLPEKRRREMGLRTLKSPNFKNIYTKSFSSPSKENETLGLELRNLFFTYPGKEVLDIPFLDIPAGKITALVGPNGAGKSTLAKILCGLLKPNRGDILINGVSIQSNKLTSRAAIVMQDVHRQLFSSSVSDEVTLGSEESFDPISLLKKLHLEKYIDRHPLSLSGGQKQRLVIAAALATNRNLLIFDEPTSGVDYEHLQEISKIFRDLANSGHILIVITHDQELVASCADRIVELSPLKKNENQITIYEK